MSDVREQPPPTASGGAVRSRRAVLVVLLAGMLIDLLDGNIVTVALPTVRRDLGADGAALQWLVAGYMLPFAVGLITGGRLGDIFGRKRIFLIGLVAFAIASAACSAAQDPGQLIAARVAQGLAASLMVPQVFAIIQAMYEPHERSGPITAAGAMYAVASVGGPVVGALLTEADIAGLGWRIIFLVNVPVAAVALVVALPLMPESRSATATRLDPVGTVVATAGLLLLLYPLTTGQEEGWPAWTFVCLAASVPVLAFFVAHQRRKGAAALMPLSLFRHRSFTAGMVSLLLCFAAVTGLLFAFTLYLQLGLGFSVLSAGVAGMWWGLSAAVFAGVALNVLGPRFGRLIVLLGLVITLVGMIALVTVTLSRGGEVNSRTVLLPMIVGGAGMGLNVALLFDFALSGVPVNDVGASSGVLNAFQQTGAALGIAVIGSLFLALMPENPADPGWRDDSGDAFALALLPAVAMIGVAFAVGFRLPRRAVHHEPPEQGANDQTTLHERR